MRLGEEWGREDQQEGEQGREEEQEGGHPAPLHHMSLAGCSVVLCDPGVGRPAEDGQSKARQIEHQKCGQYVVLNTTSHQRVG